MKVWHANESELDGVCVLLASEFFNDPVLQFAFKEKNRKIRMDELRCFFRVYVNHAMRYGGILVAENIAGALVYFRPEVMNVAERENQLLDNQLLLGCGADYAKVQTLMNGLNLYHPSASHYYAFAIAVRHSVRGGIVVSRLFNELNVRLDKANSPCYAECTRFSTRTLMRRWGYRDAGFSLKINGFPELFPVWREPHSAT